MEIGLTHRQMEAMKEEAIKATEELLENLQALAEKDKDEDD